MEQDNLYNIINEQGDTIFDVGFTNIYRDNDTKLLVVEKNGKFGLLDTKGETLVDLIYDYLAPFYDGLAVVKKDGKYGYINPKGELIIQPIYQLAKQFSKELAPVMLDGKWGYIDPENKTIIDFQYESAEPFHDTNRGIVTSKVDNKTKYHLIDSSNNKVIEDAKMIKGDGQIYAVMLENYYQLYKPNGSLFVETQFGNSIEIHDYYVMAGVDMGYMYFKKNGDLVIQKTLDTTFTHMKNQYEYEYIMNSSVEEYNHLYINESKVVLQTAQVQQIISKDLFITMNYDFKVGIMNADSEIIVEYIYDSIYQGADGYFVFKQNGLYGIMNPKYEITIQPIYDHVWPWYNIGNVRQPHQ
jgi:hypothetical protein